MAESLVAELGGCQSHALDVSNLALEGFDDQRVFIESPLDLFSPDIRSRMVIAFGLARAHGISTAELLIQTGEVIQFEIYDGVAASGCLIANPA